jgi:tRNA(fMet)-specific endonuclease VapC
MPPKFLLDTDTCIYIRQKRSEEVLRHFTELNVGEAVVSVITFGELIFGAIKRGSLANEREKWLELVHLLPVEPLPIDAADRYGSVRAELERKGAIIGNNDLWIAAHALCAGLTLVTNNEKEFWRVRGLKIENWAKP